MHSIIHFWMWWKQSNDSECFHPKKGRGHDVEGKYSHLYLKNINKTLTLSTTRTNVKLIGGPLKRTRVWSLLCLVPQWRPDLLLPVLHEDSHPGVPQLGAGGARRGPAVPVRETLLHAADLLPPAPRPVQVHDRLLDQLCQDRVISQHAMQTH